MRLSDLTFIFVVLFCLFSFVCSAPKADPEEFEEEDFETQFEQTEKKVVETPLPQSKTSPQKSSEIPEPTTASPSKPRSNAPQQKRVIEDEEEFEDFGEEDFYVQEPRKTSS
eukprot:TRINITY_DN6778_c0_g1_i1.p3 TRINITY_DN6778_c0_g1~~TRINITY_DN6778_c0_g1_i1.p3  ORF type:complete len:112 (+),score=37.52 TRINITY_DN6778_c0_g1_i1:569-904(+)